MAVRSEAQGGRRGFRPKPRNRAVVARFQARRVERRCGEMRRGGGRGIMRRQRQGGCTFANARRGDGVWPKIRNRAAGAQFRVCGFVPLLETIQESGGLF